MTGFDSEADRRDAIRKQIVFECMRLVNQTIGKTSVTKTPEERAILVLDVVLGLMQSMQIDARQAMWVKEARDAESKL